MKKWGGFSVIATVIVTGILVSGGCAGAGYGVINGILNNTLNMTGWQIKMFKWCANGVPIVSDIDTLARNKTYIVLLQNNRELRPTGGFMGSYVRLSFGEHGLAEMKVMDIYQPDGQLPGHVEPPYPIQEAFGQGWWKLRDANWDVDSASAAATVDWFFEQGKEPPDGSGIDGIIGINLDWIGKWLAAVGPVQVVTYDQTVDENNIYSLAQNYAELNFTPGSTSKRDFLGAVGVALWEKTKAGGLRQWAKLAEMIRQELKDGQIWIWMKDPQMQQIVEQKQWAGKPERGNGDYLYVVETNLGSNKANCCIQRRIVQEISGKKEKITINWKNNGEFENPRPPDFWGGNYLDYVRVLIPEEAVIEQVSVDGKRLRLAEASDFAGPSSLRQGISEGVYNVEKRGDLQIVGFWTRVTAGGESAAEIEYSLPAVVQSVRVNRQPGIVSFPYTLIKDGKVIFEGVLDKQRDFAL